MSIQYSSRPLIIGITFLAAMILMLIPLPDWARPWRPEWLAVMLIYWSMNLPKNVDVGIAWMLGLCIDVIYGTLLGQHALGFAIISYITIRFHTQAQDYPLYQQALFVGIVLLPYMSVSLWILGILGESPQSWLYWTPVLTSILVWPAIHLLLRATIKAS